MNSIWSETGNLPAFEKLQGNVKTDVLVIGGGMAGLLCAYMLDKSGVDYILVEADRICGGVTRNTTAKITLQHSLIYSDLLKKSFEKAQMYYKANLDALNEYKQICKGIDCGFLECSSTVYSKNDITKIEEEKSAYERLGIKSKFLDDISVPDDTVGAVKIYEQAQFHPLKFAAHISEKLNIYENTRVLDISEGVALTSGGRIFAKNIIVATHFPLINKHGLYFMKMFQHRSYAVALKNAEKPDSMYVDESDCGLSFRAYKDMLILGGGGHRTGRNIGGFKELVDFIKKHYEDSQIVTRWATQDCITLDKLAYIGKYSKNTPNLYVATGFNKWGMTSSMVGAKILTDIITTGKSIYEELFSPSRSMVKSKLAVNIAHSAAGLLTPTAPRCTHMGCALKYNKQEHSWDCGCHGSRFDEKGRVLDNPATKKLWK